MNNYELPASIADYMKELADEGVPRDQYQSRIKRYIEFKARGKGTPVHVTFELTPLCNLDCRMCYVHLNQEQMKGAHLLPVETWKDLMQQAYDLGMMSATLTGGECTTYPGFRELYLFLQDRGVDLEILSNGELIDQEMIRFFKAHPPTRVQISLYGASEDAYERVTGRRVFEKVLSNIDAMLEEKLPVSGAITLSKYMTDAEDILELLEQKGISRVINSGLMEPRNDTERGLTDADPVAYARLLRLERKFRGMESLSACSVEELPEPGGDKTEFVPIKCGAGQSSYALDWQGIMRPCNVFPEIKQDALKLGVKTAWNLVHKKTMERSAPVECNGCCYESICKSCMSEHAAHAEAGHASRVICSWIQTLVAEGVYSIPDFEQGFG